jgi:hypothetical protein
LYHIDMDSLYGNSNSIPLHPIATQSPGGRGVRGGGTWKVFLLSTPTRVRPHRRGRALLGKIEIFFVNFNVHAIMD